MLCLWTDGANFVTTAPVHSITAVMNLATLHKTAPTRFLPQEHHATKTGLIPGHDTPTPKGRDHISLTIGTENEKSQQITITLPT